MTYTVRFSHIKKMCAFVEAPGQLPSLPSPKSGAATHQQPVGVGLHYQLPIWVDTSHLPASHNHNTPTAGRRGATLSATYLGGHLTFTSITQLQHTNSR